MSIPLVGWSKSTMSVSSSRWHATFKRRFSDVVSPDTFVWRTWSKPKSSIKASICPQKAYFKNLLSAKVTVARALLRCSITQYWPDMVVKWWAVVLLSQVDICAVYLGGVWFVYQPGGDQRTLITGERLSSTMSVQRSIIPAPKQQYHNTIYNGILTAIIPLCYLPDRRHKEAHYQCTDITHQLNILINKHVLHIIVQHSVIKLYPLGATRNKHK
jgi:hypothetical protein